MMSRFHRFLVVLALLQVVGFSVAILDRTETTTKPPKRREPVLPWYLSGKDYVEPDEDSDLSRSPKWRVNPDDPSPRKPLIVNSASNNWSPWRKAPGSEIEQRTEVKNDPQFETHLDQNRQHPLEYDEFEQQENPKFPSDPNASTDFSQTQQSSHLKHKTHGGKVPGEYFDEHKHEGNVDRDVYEGVPTDSTKPHKEKILVSSKPKSTIAQYDPQLGVQCPDIESSGQFVYPPDCKFFVNCWKGRPFVQPCAPGTLFNPDTLECDFPHKVKCYGGELADFPSKEHLDSSGRREPLLASSHLEREKIQTLRCPPHVTGLLAHPTDCTKFLQCANGGTFIMDCGPGTVFNPAVSVCDWPYNVRGCEDALKSNEDTEHSLTPPNFHDHEGYNHKKLDFHSNQPVKKIACPSDYTGLLPHPETCKKFLQCDRGGTFIMDCGPGTAFNPAISVCDWPYNVPGCSEEKATTTPKPWSPHGSSHPGTWQHPPRFNHTSPGHHIPGAWHPGQNRPITTTSAPPTDWESLRPTWRPSWKPNTWTTETPAYDHHHYPYEDSHGSDRYKEHGQWKPVPSSDSDQTTRWPHEHHEHDGYHHNHPVHHPDGGRDTRPGPPYGHPHHQTPGNDEHGRPSWPANGHHYGHHHEHHHDHHQGRPYEVPDDSDESDESPNQTPQSPYDQTGTQGNRFDHRPNHDSGLNQENWPGNRRIGQEYPPNRREHGRTGPGFPHTGFDHTQTQDGNVYIDDSHNLPVPQSTGSTKPVFPWNFGTNRTVLVWSTKNRTSTQPPTPGGPKLNPGTWTGQGQLPTTSQNRPWDQAGSFYNDFYVQCAYGPNHEDRMACNIMHGDISNFIWSNGMPYCIMGLNDQFTFNTSRSFPIPSCMYHDPNLRGDSSIRFKVLDPKLDFQLDQKRIRGTSANDSGPDADKKWESGSDIYQTTSDKEADAKFHQWASRTNIYDNAKGQPRPGVKDTTQDSTNPFSPSSVYVDVNGTRGHFITKELEVNQGHSKTRTYRPNDLQTANTPRDNGNNYVGPHSINTNGQPATGLLPPYYSPVNRSNGASSSPDLTGSESTGYHHVIAPPTNYQPHQQPPSRSQTWTPSSHYPPIPSSNLQPPFYESSNATQSNYGSQYPIPSTDMQPPFYESSNFTQPNRGRQYSIPSSDLQPPFYETPNFTQPNVGSQYPKPSIFLQPPFYETPNYTQSNVGSQYPKPSIYLQPPSYAPYNRTPNFMTSPNFYNGTHYYPPVPSSDLEPPYYEPSSGSLARPNSTKSYRMNNYNPTVPSSDLQPPDYEPSSGSLAHPNSTKSYRINSYNPTVPSSDLLPPYYEPSSGSLAPPNSTKSYRINSYNPTVPSSDLLPPYYEPSSGSQAPPNSTKSNRINNYNPTVPSSDLQPPFYDPPSRSLTSPNATVPWMFGYRTPAPDLQPPYDESNSTDSPHSHGQHPTRPAAGLQPPYFDPVTKSTVPPRLNNHTQTTTQRVPDKHLILPVKKKVLQATWKQNRTSLTEPNVPTVSIENNDNSTKIDDVDVVEPDIEAYDVDVLDDKKEVWKPVLVFENKTKTTVESSVIMKINRKKNDVDLFNIEEAPFEKEEPPFPVYYVPPVQPLDHSSKKSLFTPISGQVIRLRGGSGPHTGYVEVQGANPGWGTVCDSRNSWTLKEAHVVCRQLGYVRGAEMAWQGRNNRDGVPTWIAASSVTCHGNETRFQSCKFTHEQQCRVERDAIGVRCVLNRVAHCRRDEVPYDGQCYHLADPESGLNHAEALDYCTRRGARLLDITSQSENDFVSEWLLQGHADVGSVMTSGVGFTTMNRTLWVWEDSSRAKFRFTKWWPGWLEDMKHPPFVGSRPLCIVMKRKFPCHERPDSICVADYFFWDSEDCATSMKGHSYICKRPYDDIGCIYGKGNQYVGKANVTASGKDCLPWADEKVAHPLRVTVVNRDVIEKLKGHNFCRNPNSQKESRPWCFTGPSGQREHCDIPPCGNIGSKRSLSIGQCKPKHFECLPGECIPSPWVCDGEEDCTNGADEKACTSNLNLYQKYSKHKLEGYDVEKWLNTPLKTCALRCKEADFTCRSFAHKAAGNVCLLSDSNVGMTGSLKPNKEFDYYEMKDRSVNCEGMYVCGNRKCINQTEVCNGKNDCNDRTDESMCTVETLDYEIRLAGSNNSHEGRVEVKILGVWGQVCDDGFGMINADVICKELGFVLGALEVRPGGFYGNLEPPSRFMVDQLKCRGNETTLRECDFDGWGVHNCQPEEAVGVVCKTAVNTCPDGHWKCDKSPTCIPTAFICDEVVDCPDKSDESPSHCEAPFEIRLANGSSPLEGRVEVRHHGVWGTVCDDDFSNATAAVICRSLGYGGIAKVKKNGFFGPGEGPIWLDEVFCHGNETQLYRCEHNHWGQHNCNHDEDAGVICTPGDVNDSELLWETVPDLPETSVNDLLPSDCGKRFKDFNDDEDLIFAKVVHGSVAPKGTYPWQASIRVRGHSRSSHWCGAVVLSPLHVLTAAHCLEGYNKGTYFVRAGDYNTEIDEGTEAEANIEDYYIHEDFRKGHRMNNDIALVLLKGRGISLGRDVMPICLPSENTEYPPGLNCTISGFGSIETGKSTHSKDLRYGWVPLLDQSVCRAGHIYGEGAISDGMVCAGYLDEGVDTCDGDSGGPLACYHNGAFTLYGITSWGQHCGKANKPGVYVRVSYYRRWIDQKIRESLVGR